MWDGNIVVEKRSFSTALFVTVVTRKPPPYRAEKYSSQAPLAPVDTGKRNTEYISNAPVSTQHGAQPSARNLNNQYRHDVGLSITGLSLDRPSHSYTNNSVIYGHMHVAPHHSGTSSCYQPRTAVASRPTVNSRPKSSIGIGTPYPATSTQLPKSHTSAASLSLSSSGTAGYHYQRPVPADPKSSSRRSLPYAAYRT